MTIFNVESDECRIMLNGLYLPAQHAIAFSNRPLPSSSFLGVRYPADWDPKSVMKNFRNDTETLLALAGSVGATETGNLDGSSNFNTLYENGIYACELRAGQGGTGVPPVKEVGVLKVETVGDLVIQSFIGEKTSMQRLFNGIRWGNWNT